MVAWVCATPSPAAPAGRRARPARSSPAGCRPADRCRGSARPRARPRRRRRCGRRPRGSRPAGPPASREPSGPVMALPPRAITTRREVTLRTLAADPLAVKYSSDGSASATPEVERSRPGRKPAASTTSTARSNSGRRRSGWWASLPKLTASPPSSWNQRTWSTEASGLVVLTSSARPVGGQRPEDRRGTPPRRPSPRTGGAAGPVPAREVDVREHLEDVAALDHVHQLAEVPAHGAVGVGATAAGRRRPAGRPRRASAASRAPGRRARRADSAATLAANRCGSPVSTPDQIRSSGNRSRHLGQLGEVALDVDGGCCDGCRPTRPSSVARSSASQTVKSRCSVNAIAGQPQARPRARRPGASSRSPGCPTTTGCARGCPAVASLWILLRRPQVPAPRVVLSAGCLLSSP